MTYQDSHHLLTSLHSSAFILKESTSSRMNGYPLATHGDLTEQLAPDALLTSSRAQAMTTCRNSGIFQALHQTSMLATLSICTASHPSPPTRMCASRRGINVSCVARLAATSRFGWRLPDKGYPMCGGCRFVVRMLESRHNMVVYSISVINDHALRHSRVLASQ